MNTSMHRPADIPQPGSTVLSTNPGLAVDSTTGVVELRGDWPANGGVAAMVDGRDAMTVGAAVQQWPGHEDLATTAAGRRVLVVLEGALPDGVIGLSSAEHGAIWLDRRQRHRKYLETFLHEVAHVVLGHSSDQPGHVEARVEEFAVRVAAELMALGAVPFGGLDRQV